MGQANMIVTRPAITHVRVLKRASLELHRISVTSIQKAASGRLFLEDFQSLDEEGDLTMEYATYILYETNGLLQNCARTVMRSFHSAGVR